MLAQPTPAASAVNFSLPHRSGPRPVTTRPTREQPRPHQQLDQFAPVALQEVLFSRAQALPGIAVGRSCVSLPGARAFRLDPSLAQGPSEAFQCGYEFAHLHTGYDGSLHLTLPPAVYQQVLDRGWGVPHPLSGTMMLFGPRDAEELETAWQVLLASYHFATGAWSAVENDGPASER